MSQDDSSEIQFRKQSTANFLRESFKSPDGPGQSNVGPSDEVTLSKQLREKDQIIQNLRGELVQQEREFTNIKKNMQLLKNEVLALNRVRTSTPLPEVNVNGRESAAERSLDEFDIPEGRNEIDNIPLQLNSPIKEISPPNVYQSYDKTPCTNCCHGSCGPNNVNPIKVVCQLPEAWFLHSGHDDSSELAPFQLLEGDVFGIERYITEFRALRAQYKWPDIKARSILEKKITGKAKALYMTGLGSQNFISMEERLHDLKKLFSLQKDKEQTRKLFNGCKQGLNEEATAYRLRLFALAEPLRPSPGLPLEDYHNMILERYNKGILPELSVELIRKGKMTLKETTDFIEDIEYKLKQLAERVTECNTIVTKTADNTVDNQITELKREVAELIKLNRELLEKEKLRKKIICNYCNSPGHLERNCRNKPRDGVIGPSGVGNVNVRPSNSNSPHS